MGRRKTVKAKLSENRCQGIGPDYVPFYKANEGGSRGTTSLIPDKIEGRMIHCLSDTETMMYYLLRWNPNVIHIREQYLLDHDLINEVRRELGYRPVSSMAQYTTDFLVDMADASQSAYSVKFRREEFDPNALCYRGREDAYRRLIERQRTEQVYWESQSVDFHIVTREDLMEHRILIKNIQFVMGFYDDAYVVNADQKLLYLIAHHVIEVSMDKEFINPRHLQHSLGLDIDSIYEQVRREQRYG